MRALLPWLQSRASLPATQVAASVQFSLPTPLRLGARRFRPLAEVAVTSTGSLAPASAVTAAAAESLLVQSRYCTVTEGPSVAFKLPVTAVTAMTAVDCIICSHGDHLYELQSKLSNICQLTGSRPQADAHNHDQDAFKVYCLTNKSLSLDSDL